MKLFGLVIKTEEKYDRDIELHQQLGIRLAYELGRKRMRAEFLNAFTVGDLREPGRICWIITEQERHELEQGFDG